MMDSLSELTEWWAFRCESDHLWSGTKRSHIYISASFSMIKINTLSEQSSHHFAWTNAIKMPFSSKKKTTHFSVGFTKSISHLFVYFTLTFSTLDAKVNKRYWARLSLNKPKLHKNFITQTFWKKWEKKKNRERTKNTQTEWVSILSVLLRRKSSFA